MRNFVVLVGVIGLTTSARAQSPQLVGQLQSIAQSAAPGQVPASPVFAGFGQQNQEVPFLVPLELGRCYTFVGTVGPGVQQLSIYLFDPTGKTVAKDTSDKSIAPRVTWCTRWPGSYKILGKIKRGQGELAIQAFTAPTGAPPPPAYQPPPQAYAPPPPAYQPPPQAYAPPPQPPFAGQLHQLAGSFAPGQVPASPVFCGPGMEQQEVPFTVSLDAGRCYTVIGTVGPGVQQLSIYLFDPTGRTVSKDTSDKSISPHITYCAKFPGPYKLVGKIKRGQGQLAMQAFTPGVAAPPPGGQPIDQE